MSTIGVSIRPSSTVFFNVPSRCVDLTQPLDNRAKGGRKSMMRVRRVLEFFWLFSRELWGYGIDEHKRFKFRIAFITLTLSSEQNHSDDYIKTHMLQPFLKWAFRQGKDEHYVWKAETQGNGNIHFHISFNGFIHYRKIREKWNHLQWKHGYIEASADPNSTDVHSVRQAAGFVSYMAKYMSKTDEELKVSRPSGLIHFSPSAVEKELMYSSIACTGVPFYKRRIEGKHWAADRALLNCAAKIVLNDNMDEDEYIEKLSALQHVWDEHLKLMKCNYIKTDHGGVWEHEHDITMNSELTPPVAELFSRAFKTFHSLS